MLVEFRIANYRSIGDEQVISLVPAQKQKEFPSNIIEKGKYEALNVIAFYGSNGSGKSNLLKAMHLLDNMLSTSARSSSTTKLPYYPFLLREGYDKKPTAFEITFVLQDARYRYGFTFNQEAIISEWLFRKTVGREVNLFQRENEVIDNSAGFSVGSKIMEAAIEATRDNALFLSTCDMFNIEEAKEIFKWFRNYNMIDGLKTEDEEIRTVELWQNPEYTKRINDFFVDLNLNVTGLYITARKLDTNLDLSMLAESYRELLIQQLTGKEGYAVWSQHKTYDVDGKPNDKILQWELEDNESAGTKKAFHLSGPVLWALINGGTLIIDEIEAKMHPVMTQYTINLFLDKNKNPKQAQLIFATHDTNLLSYSALRRDQVYFTEKNQWESTSIYSLSDFVYIENNEKERPDADKEKRYFEGRYGAIPTPGNYKPSKVKDNGKKRKAGTEEN